MTDPDQRPDGFVCKKRVRRQKIFPPLLGNTCKTGWIYYNYTNACYYLQNFTDPNLLNSKLFSWREAEMNCRGFGAHLTSVHSTYEREFVKDLATSDLSGPLGLSEWDDGCAYDHYAWIGLHKFNNTRIYTDDTIDDFFTFENKPPPNEWFKIIIMF
ncbi:unnamed protein product, partial [Mesorhabditis belari]|uniref:C-type lectin domain-containing protein n=1 Tax=Mesorhabditis belari TaxID=2138241 RepID=A0AAF3EKU8_9BILA